MAGQIAGSASATSAAGMIAESQRQRKRRRPAFESVFVGLGPGQTYAKELDLVGF